MRRRHWRWIKSSRYCPPVPQTFWTIAVIPTLSVSILVAVIWNRQDLGVSAAALSKTDSWQWAARRGSDRTAVSTTSLSGILKEVYIFHLVCNACKSLWRGTWETDFLGRSLRNWRPLWWNNVDFLSRVESRPKGLAWGVLFCFNVKFCFDILHHVAPPCVYKSTFVAVEESVRPELLTFP